MSFQQDKRVVRPSKWSERYARWFSTRVLSTSPMFRYIVMFSLALPWSIAYLAIFGMIVDFIVLLSLSTAIGLVVYMMYLSILKNRFELPIPDKSFLQLVNSAIDKTATGGRVSVWMRFDEEPYITSTYNSGFEAVIISKKMMELMMAMPVSGEAVVAFHLLRMPKNKNVIDIFAGAFVFTSLATFIVYAIASLSTLFPYSGYMLLLVFASSLWMIYLAPIFFVLILRSAFWTHESAFERTEKIYGIHPQVAKDEVLSAQKMDEELTKSTIWSVKIWEERKRSGRRASISVSLTLVLFGIAIFVTMMNPTSFYYIPWETYLITFGLPILLGTLIFFAIKRWDRNCMDEIYYSVTDAHEQIWFD
ncbi:hypothetical protein EU528_12300 [Candidatus Thorarchaeota archaeon]|nr:MAG: hypothetical protein EU528_12300 [Candidatus Thorarchaeota archaeon]